MRLLSKRQLKEMVLYSPQHIQRLENAGRFPRRVRLGNGPRCRVGWIEAEVLDWLQAHIKRRDIPTDHSPDEGDENR
jgi:prophage regulatory protein